MNNFAYISLCKIISEKKLPKYRNTAKIKTKIVTMIMMIMINCFCGTVAERRGIKHCFHLEPLFEVLSITNLQQIANRI